MFEKNNRIHIPRRKWDWIHKTHRSRQNMMICQAYKTVPLLPLRSRQKTGTWESLVGRKKIENIVEHCFSNAHKHWKVVIYHYFNKFQSLMASLKMISNPSCQHDFNKFYCSIQGWHGITNEPRNQTSHGGHLAMFAYRMGNIWLHHHLSFIIAVLTRIRKWIYSCWKWSTLWLWLT